MRIIENVQEEHKLIIQADNLIARLSGRLERVVAQQQKLHPRMATAQAVIGQKVNHLTALVAHATERRDRRKEKYGN